MGAIRAPHAVEPHPSLHHPSKEGEDAPQREQHGGAVHTPSARTNAIRRAHNGPAQVAQVAVCHVWRAAAEIDWEAFPK